MINLFTYVRSWVYPNLLLMVSACLVTACVKPPQKKAADPKRQDLQHTLTEREASLRTMAHKMATIQLRSLEKDAQIKILEERLDSQQAMLDEAILEVVRTKAKLRSLDSKAEAASEMAEAEIAIKALKVRSRGGGAVPDVSKAEQLLKMSGEEFNKENYGGALYLASQAKGHLRASQMRIEGPEKIESVVGETLFAQPVPLKVLTTSNLRQGPGLNSKILAQLEKGTTLIGYSYKGQWVRVTSEGGTRGWIHQTLVGGR